MSSASIARPIRVLHMGSPTGLYGAERWILALIRHLPKADVHSIVGVVKDVPHEEPALVSLAAKLGYETFVCEAIGKLNIKSVTGIRAFVLRNHIDVLHTHGYKTDIAGVLATAGTRCKLIATPHGWSTDAGFKLMVYEALDRFAYYGADAVVPLSADLEHGLRRLPGLKRKVHLIPNGVDLSEVDEHVSAAGPRSSRDTREKLAIGYVGQLIPRKGVDVLLRAFAKLQRADAELSIVGDGPMRGELAELSRALGIDGNVRFLGYREDRLSLMQQFDVFVLPSSLEGIPRVLMEVMASGIMAIASDIPGARALITHGVHGELFPVGDDTALCNALARAASDPQRRLALAQAGNERVRREFSAEAMAQRYLQLYRCTTGLNVTEDSRPLGVSVG